MKTTLDKRGTFTVTPTPKLVSFLLLKHSGFCLWGLSHRLFLSSGTLISPLSPFNFCKPLRKGSLVLPYFQDAAPPPPQQPRLVPESNGTWWSLVSHGVVS